MQITNKEKQTGKKARQQLTRAQKLRRLSLWFLPVGIILGIAGMFAGIAAGRVIYVRAFTAPAVSLSYWHLSAVFCGEAPSLALKSDTGFLTLLLRILPGRFFSPAFGSR